MPKFCTLAGELNSCSARQTPDLATGHAEEGARSPPCGRPVPGQATAGAEVV